MEGSLPVGLERLIAALQEVLTRSGPPTPAARKLYWRMVEEFPAEATSWLLLSEMHRDDDARPEALAAARKGVELDPEDPHVLVMAAERMLEVGAPDDAEVILARAKTRADPDDRSLRGLIIGTDARLHDERGHVEQAEELFATSVEVLPEYDYHWLRYAAFLADRRRFDEAARVAAEGLRRFRADEALMDLRLHLSQQRTRRRTSTKASSTGAARVRWTQRAP